MRSAPRYVILSGLVYTHNLVHRDWSREKSQWTISELLERKCFVHSCRKQWLEPGTTWGLHFHRGEVEYLGLGRDHQTRVFIAKFVHDPGIDEWHGYPVDHRRPGDKPPKEVLDSWLRERILAAPKIRKIKGNQPCKL